MKNILFWVIVFGFLSSCNSVSVDKEESKKDSAVVENEDNSLILNNLLIVKNIDELIQKYGNENVKRTDTIWGSEGEFTLGTFLFKGTGDEVSIMWNDDKNLSGVIAVEVNAKYDENTYKPVFNSKWKTKDGIYLGMSLEDLVKMNEKPINFYGFGWDYSGMVVSFNNGKLEGSGVGLALYNTADESKMNEKENMSIIGDQELTTKDNDFSKFAIKVTRISVHIPDPVTIGN